MLVLRLTLLIGYSDDSGGFHQPRSPVHSYPQYSSTPAISANFSAIVSGDPNSPYVDDVVRKQSDTQICLEFILVSALTYGHAI